MLTQSEIKAQRIADARRAEFERQRSIHAMKDYATRYFFREAISGPIAEFVQHNFRKRSQPAMSRQTYAVDFNAECQVHARRGLEAARQQEIVDAESRERVRQQANEHARRNVIAHNIAVSEQHDFRNRVQSIMNEYWH